MTAEEYRKYIAKAASKNKYNAQKTKVDGITFDSKKEAEYYGKLKLLKKAGEIKDFELQVRFPITHKGVKITTYVADFVVVRSDGTKEVIDVKSEATKKLAAYRIKKKLVKAFYGITIKEV